MGIWGTNWVTGHSLGSSSGAWLPFGAGTAVPVEEFRAPRLDRRLSLELASGGLSEHWWVAACAPGAAPGAGSTADRRDRPVSEFMLNAARRLTALGCVAPSDGALNHDRYIYGLPDEPA